MPLVVTSLSPAQALAPSEYRFELSAPWHRVENGAQSASTIARLGIASFGELALHWERRCARVALLCGIARVLEASLVDLPLAASAITVSHEAFGHAARAREFGVTPDVSLVAPVPYVFLDPAIDPRTANSVRLPERRPRLSRDERELFILGGYQAQEWLARAVSFGAFRTGTLTHGDAFVYQFEALHRAATVLVRGGDYNAHLAHLSVRYGARISDEHGASLASALITTSLDPLFWFSFYAAYVRFIVRGERAVAYPALTVGRGVRVSFTSRLLFVPWGREQQIDLYVATRYAAFDAALRVGTGPGSGSIGLSLSAMQVRPMRWLRLGAQLDLWAQPALSVLEAGGTTPSPSASEARFGVGGSVLAELLAGSGFVGIRIGGKSAGLVAEQPYAATFLFGLTAGVTWSGGARAIGVAR